MELVKHGHACVSLGKAGRRLVIDPGAWTEPEALREADAVLVTHDHVDHVGGGAAGGARGANRGMDARRSRGRS